ncbi:MAG: hypothetical protein KGN76_04325 [Acidobacteriota bacterium]|nr:hypothetical protein [Acidobacteriota bacterium]
MPRDFTIYVVSPPGYRHVLAFAEVANGLLQALGELGYRATLTQDPAAIEGRALVLAPHLIPASHWRPPADAILYNFEQAADSSEWFTRAYLDLLRRHEVWDYSQANLEYLSSRGVTGQLVPVGYAPCLTRIQPAPEDIDVLAYGALSDRRIAILDALRARGAKVRRLFDVYGEKRDRYIARARIVLNIHTYEARLFEIVRVSYLLANSRCVVSEEGTDASLEAPYREAVTFAPYEQLVDTTLALLADPAACTRRAAAGFEIFQGRAQRDFLREVLGARRQESQ